MKESIYTGGIPNGYWLDENTNADADLYILGIADGLFARRNNLKDPLCPHNPTLNRGNVIEAVKLYYKQAPENKFRQIVAVIRGGCSEAL